ncbi:ABC transporter permease [Salinicoccus sp. Marseille-QA3877]
MGIFKMTYQMMLINFKDFGYWFWTLLYPLLLSTLFILTTSNITGDSMDDIPVGITEEHQLAGTLTEIDILEVTETTESDGLTLMEDDELSGFITEDNELLVTTSGLDQTILESVLNEITQVYESGIPAENFSFDNDLIVETDADREPQVVMFYSLIAMMVFYTMFSSIEFITTMQPNLSTMGARFQASPYNKIKLLMASAVGALFLGLLTNFVIISYLMIFYQGTLFNEFLPTVILLIIGNIAGIGIGFAVGLFPKINANFKTFVGLIVLLALTFSAGMIGPGVRMLVNENLPIVNELNPVALLTDTLFRINLMGNFDDYMMTLAILTGIAVVMFMITLIVLRRKQYDSL